MPAPASVDEFLSLVRKSGVLDEKRLDTQLSTIRAAAPLPERTDDVASLLVREGVLTNFQARQFLLGRWKRFVVGNKYKLLELIGAGGMGAVYLCEHIRLHQVRALKVLPTEKLKDESAVARFYREARAVAALDHPNIVRAHDVDQDGNLHYLVMEYVDGSSLQDIVARHGPMDPVRAAHYIAQAALGLQHAFESGQVHRDIKPGNLLLDRSGTVKILDLGLARFFDSERPQDNITEQYNEKNSVLGTADYLAPEQATQTDVDVRADIYSLGGTFYYLLTGRAPFQEGNIAQKILWHQTRNPKPIPEIRPEVPEAMVHVIETMLAKRADDRYQTPLDVVIALEEWTQQPIGPPPADEMPQLSPAAKSAGRSEGPRTPSPSSVVQVARTVPAVRPPSGPRIGPAEPTPQPRGTIALSPNGSGRPPAGPPKSAPPPPDTIRRPRAAQPASRPALPVPEPPAPRSRPAGGAAPERGGKRWGLEERHHQMIAWMLGGALGGALLVLGVLWVWLR
jgi:serine/threonine protein kinase